jgi:GNAT superfamily N-acetyltransferase
MSDVLVRDATDADWGAVWPFVRGVFGAGETYTVARDVGEGTARDYWFPAAGGTVVAVDGGVPVGIAKWSPNHGGAGAHVANAAFLVDPAHGGKGIGRALGEHVLERARADGYRAMVFNAVVATNTGAIALWESLGFAVVGRVPEAFDHPRRGLVDLLVMHRVL